MKKIGVTGSIASGKSIVSKVLEALSYPVYDSDTRAKEIIVENVVVRNSIISLLGNEAYLESGDYNRKFVGEKVFSNPRLLNKLNDIVHPAVKDDFEQWCLTQNSNLVFKESALLLDNIEVGELDYIICVFANENVRIERIKKRDKHRSDEQIKHIIERQGDWGLKSKKADFIILNNENDYLVPQVKKIIESLSF